LSHTEKNEINNEYTIVDGGHVSQVNSLQFVKIEDNTKNTSLQLLSASHDHNFCRWKLNNDLNSIELVETINVGDAIPSCLVATKNICHDAINNNLLPYVILGYNNIFVHDIVKKKIVGSYIGHASIINYFKLSNDNNYLLSSAQDRFIYVWKLKNILFRDKNKKISEKKLSLQNAICGLSLNDDIVAIDMYEMKNTAEKNRIVYYIGGASKTHVYIWLFDPKINGKSKTKKKKKNNDDDDIVDTNKDSATLHPIVKIKMNNDVGSDNFEHSTIHTFRFIDSKNLLVVRGSSSFIVFKKIPFAIIDKNVTLNENEYNEKIMQYHKEIQLDIVKIKELQSINNNENNNNDFMIKVDAHLNILDVADATIPEPKLATLWEKSNIKNANKKTKIVGEKHKDEISNIEDNNNINNFIDVDNDMDTFNEESNTNTEKNHDNDQNDDDTNTNLDAKEPARKKYKLTNVENSNDEVTFGMKLAMIEKENEENMKLEMKNEIPTADSLALLLTQSLASNDEKMFEDLLIINKEYDDVLIKDELIHNTLDRISSDVALLLLLKLNEKFRTNYGESMNILRWLIPLLNKHAGFFSSNLNSRQYLVSVYQSIDYHLKSMMPALKLQGRLSLLMNQINKVNNLTNNTNADANNKNIQRDKKNVHSNSNAKIDAFKMAKVKTLFLHFDK